ncbi:ABC transporter ATP-binding protein [Acidipila sp. EB88]|uniref:ABC transporter ATP-binding protein n=1 Tax=Acidipila sp. EB88 TaxID=2305226 RepID=UPI000F5E675D|nr:ABC transporter ATP-binding protein [Acidipila sp. EB88]RRA47300.1 ABC transporter ATP-binding protein [Acidipila sp. EB88]
MSTLSTPSSTLLPTPGDDSLSRASGQTPSPIELKGLSHSYGTRKALDDLSFSVQPGEIFGLLGPNGSGKTTLFRILSTLMIPTGGAARIAGFDVATQASAVRLQTGIVFQARSIDLKLTVRENLMHQGHLYGMSGQVLRRRIDEVLGRVLLLDRAGDFVETLSGGMQRRVELAKGLIHAPAVLLLDEPSTGLDPGARRDLWQYLRTLRDEDGVTVLVTTHLMEEAEHCDRLAILSAGRLVALGAPLALREQIGGDIVTFDTRGPAEAQALALRLAAYTESEPRVLGASVRVEHSEGHRFVTAMVEAFPGQIEGIRVQKPSLEDVFIESTGHRFWQEQGPEAEPDAHTRETESHEGFREPL